MRRSPMLPLCLCALSIASCAVESPEAEPIRRRHQALNGPRHQLTTMTGVSAWVTPATADAFVAVSTIGDSDPSTNDLSRTHFDNCYWDEGRDWILEKRADTVNAALQYDLTGADADRTLFFNSFGYVLHAAEDFYSHSNWVETHEPGMLANFSDPGVQKPDGWVSGTYNNSGDNGPNAGSAHCPFGTLPHSIMNKDGAGGLYGNEAFLDASLAVTVELRKLILAIRSAAPATAHQILGKLGFLPVEPATTTSRSDRTQTLAVAGAGLGLFVPPLFCRPGTFASGFDQRVEATQGDGDDTALNAVALLCSNPAGEFVERLSAWEGVWGTWNSPINCKAGQFITRGALKLESTAVFNDGTAANAARFACGNGTTLAAANDAAWGEWGSDQACGAGEAVCGIELASLAPQDSGDDLAMTGMRLHCCTVGAGVGGTGGSAGTAGSAGGPGGGAGMGGTSSSGGSAGAGGLGGSAGSGTGGTNATGGSPSMSGSGGMAASGGLDAGTSSEAAPDTSLKPGEDSGCSCRLKDPTHPDQLAGFTVAAMCAWLLRRRRTQRPLCRVHVASNTRLGNTISGLPSPSRSPMVW